MELKDEPMATRNVSLELLRSLLGIFLWSTFAASGTLSHTEIQYRLSYAPFVAKSNRGVLIAKQKSSHIN